MSHRVAFLRLQTAWQNADKLKVLGAGVSLGAVPPRNEWGFTAANPVLQPPRKKRLIQMAMAASVLMFLSFSVAWYLWPPAFTQAYRTPVGGLASVPMPDGSKVTLNTDSEVRIAVTDTERRVRLEHGEAFFDVAKDAARPFIVIAGDKRVIAVGTQFSVLRQGRDVRVIVTEGKVRVEEGGTQQLQTLAQLSAGAIVRTSSSGTTIEEQQPVKAQEALSWRGGYLIFRGTPLAQAAAEFNRYNTRKITIGSPAVAAIRIGGNFRSTNVDAFIRLVQDGFPVQVRQHEDRIVLTPR